MMSSWRRGFGAALSLCMAMVWAGVFFAAGAQAQDSGRYIVVLNDSVKRPGAVADRHEENRGASPSFIYRTAIKGYAAVLSEDAVDAIRKDPTVAYVEPDVRGGIAAQTTPTGVDRVFATANGDLDIDETDDKRVDVDVAVFDTGVDPEHPDLNVVSQLDCNSGPFCTPGGGDGNGHGTHVAGTIGAIDNDYGVVGVAPGARIWSVKVLSNSGHGALSQFIAGIDWVTARADEIEVANASLRYWSESSSEAFDEAIAASIDAGVMHVAAAGNESEEVRLIPGNNPDMITVSALDDADGSAGAGEDPLAYFSNFGPIVDIAAPGVDIYSTLPSNSYGSLSGTSMASPHVAAGAAILASQSDPTSREDVETIQARLINSGNFDWVDTSEDGAHEPLLDVSESPPITTTLYASEVKGTSAKLLGAINPKGTSTSYQFEYGKTTAYGSKVPISPKSIGAGTEFVVVNDLVEGLSPATTYHFRIVAIQESGAAVGTDQTFTTRGAPKANTQAPTGVMSSSARLNATVNPEGTPTTYQFEYGTTTSYGTSIPVPAASVGSGESNVNVGKTISGLSKGTTYHYRVVASNEAGTTNGADKTFTTAEAPAWATQYPSAGLNTETGLQGVSCQAADDCMAVGFRMDAESKSTVHAMAKKWDGVKWTLQSPPMPSGSTGGILSNVSCPSTEDCVATGVYTDTASQDRRPLAEVWDGAKWSRYTVPQPEGATYASLDGISCTSAEACVAVGVYSNDQVVYSPFAALWNGLAWSLSTVPEAEGVSDTRLYGVSCHAAEECVAVGWAKFGGLGTPVAASWNGSEWTVQPTPLPEGALIGALTEVSCLSGEGCVAVGMKVELEPSVAVSNYAVGWNGSEWTPQPVSMSEAATYSQLRGVSCTSLEGCIAVGHEQNGSEGWPTAHGWNGSEWQQQQLPEPLLAKPGSLSSVSCTGVDECMAVGSIEYESLTAMLG